MITPLTVHREGSLAPNSNRGWWEGIYPTLHSELMELCCDYAVPSRGNTGPPSIIHKRKSKSMTVEENGENKQISCLCSAMLKVKRMQT